MSKNKSLALSVLRLSRHFARGNAIPAFETPDSWDGEFADALSKALDAYIDSRIEAYMKERK